jgi:hypothetical protein
LPEDIAGVALAQLVGNFDEDPKSVPKHIYHIKALESDFSGTKWDL